jgi:uncharacterized MnhB-related membrane protein
MLAVGYVVVALVVVAGAVVAVMGRNLVHAAVSLGVGSAALAMLFFMLRAPYAGGFELSVGAGLISALFIVAISLTQRVGRGRREP